MNSVRENVRRATGWLDDKLVPLLGPATNGPWEPSASEDAHAGEADALCPVCHHAINRHIEETDARTHHTFLRCPDSGTVIETQREAHEPGTETHPLLT